MLVPADDQTSLHVGVTGAGPDVVVLSGGPGCVHYLEDDDLAPRGMRAWYPEPRGVGRSQGGPHDLGQAVADLEAVRRANEIDRWLVLGHYWGSDLAVRYALEHPDRVHCVAMDGFMSDPRRTALATDRDRAVARTEIVPVRFI